MRIVQYQTVYKNSAYYCGPGPAVVSDENGDLTLLFRRVRSWLKSGLAGHWHPSTETCLTRSTDGGTTWSSPRILFAGHQCPCLTRLSDGTLVYHTHRTELVSADIVNTALQVRGVSTTHWPGIHAGTFVQRSGDGGLNWSNPTFLHGVPGIEPLHPDLSIPVGVRGNILDLANGQLLVSAYSCGRRASVGPDRSHLFASSDGGNTWSYRSTIANGYNETYLHQTPSGTLVAWMRKDDATDLKAVLHVSRSNDEGATWSDPVALFKGFPACVGVFGSGTLCLAYGYRMDDAFGVRARLLSEEGEPLDNEEIRIRDDGAVTDLGYPHATTLPDGRVFLVYYINRNTDAQDHTAPRYIESALIDEQ